MADGGGHHISRHTKQDTAMAGNAEAKEAVCYFIDRLSTETRIAVYKHVFGSAPYARSLALNTLQGTASASVSPKTNGVQRIETNILQTNKLIHDEALDTFLDSHTIRVTFRQLQLLLQRPDVSNLLRNVQIVDCRLFAGDSAAIHGILKTVLGQTKIKNVVVLTESLAEQATKRTFKTTRQWVKRHKLGKLVCMDVGKYEVRTEQGTVKLQNSKIVKMWPEATSTPPQYDVIEAVRRLMNDWWIAGPVSNPAMWASHTSFRVWVGLYDLMLRTLYGNYELSTSAQPGEVYLHSWAHNLIWRDPDLQLFPETHYDGVGVHRFGPHTKKSVLENFSELLAVNIEAYQYLPEHLMTIDGRGVAVLKKPVWPALTGGESEGARQGKINREIHEAHVIKCPVNDAKWIIEDVQTVLIRDTGMMKLLGEEAILDADKEELTSIWYYLLAMKTPLVKFSSNEEATKRLHGWCKEVLVKYLSTASGTAPVDLKTITLAGARKLIKYAEEFVRGGMPSVKVSPGPADASESNNQHKAAGHASHTCVGTQKYELVFEDESVVWEDGPCCHCDNIEAFLSATGCMHSIGDGDEPIHCAIHGPLMEKIRSALHVMVLLYQRGMVPFTVLSSSNRTDGSAL